MIPALLLFAITGCDAPSARPDGGLIGEVFPMLYKASKPSDLEGETPLFVGLYPAIDFERTGLAEFGDSRLGERLMVRWTGWLDVPKTGDYRFEIVVDDKAQVYIDEALLLDAWSPDAENPQTASAEIALEAGKVPLRIVYFQNRGSTQCQLRWAQGGGELKPIDARHYSHDPERLSGIAWNREFWEAQPYPLPERSTWTLETHDRDFAPDDATDLEQHHYRKRQDYDPNLHGPFVHCPIQLGEENGEELGRVVVIPLDEDAQNCLVYDLDTLRVAAAWTDRSLMLQGVPYTDWHGPVPRSYGDFLVRTPPGPAWAKDGDFEDPRTSGDPKIGPLPLDWLDYHGIRLKGRRPQLEYSVHGTRIVDRPDLRSLFQFHALCRTLTIDPHQDVLEWCVAAAVDAATVSVNEDGLSAEVGGTSMTVAGEAEARFQVRGSRLVLRFEPKQEPSSTTLLMWKSSTEPPSRYRQHLVAEWKEPGLPQAQEDLLWPDTVTTEATLGEPSDGFPYATDRLQVPESNPYEVPFQIAAFDFFSGGTRAAVSTWQGDVWIVENLDESLSDLRWKRFATGLNEPLGLKIIDDQILTVGGDQITRFHDEDGNGEADFYECFSNRWEKTAAFHTFAMDLQQDEEGNLYFALTAPVSAGGRGFDRVTRHHGSILKVSPDGRSLTVKASGFRAPNGLAIGPEGQMICSENEGTLVPACAIFWIEPGDFGGVPDTYQGSEPLESTPFTDPGRALDQSEMPEPMIWLPKSIENSPASPAWIPADDRFGPLADSLIHLSYGRSCVFSLLPDQTHGDNPIQAAAFKWPLRTTSAAMRARFNHADGSLYVSGLQQWQTNAVRPTSLDRIRYTGGGLPWPTAWRVSPEGIELTFGVELEKELAEDVESYSLQGGDLRWSYQYGSPEFLLGQRDAAEPREGRTNLPVRAARLLPDGRTVRLDVPDLQIAHMVQLDYDLEDLDGNFLTSTLWATIHALD